MPRKRTCGILLLNASCWLVAADAPPLAGDWQGSLTFNGTTQQLAFHLQNAGTAWTGSMDAVDSGVKGIPLAAIRVAESQVSFSVPSIGGSYEGVLDGKAGAISGTWSQSGIQLPLNLHRMTAAEAKGPNRPQEPKPDRKSVV